MIRIASFVRRARRRLHRLVGGVIKRPATSDDSAEALAREAFDPRFYLSAYPDIAEAGVDPLVHYFETGWREGRSPNRHFDPKYYLEHYSDVAAAGLEPLAHYMSHGASEGRNPSETFDTLWYLERHPDVADRRFNPLLHYLAFGEAEGREPRPRNDVAIEPSLVTVADPGLAAAAAYASLDPHGPSLAAAAAAAETAEHFAITEFDLKLLSSRNLSALPIVLPTRGGLSPAWEKLYLELYCRPRLMVLCGSLKDNPTATRIACAAAELSGPDSLFVLATDEVAVGRPEGLSRGIRWRSLAEFSDNLGSFDRSALVTALLHSVQPDAVVVVDSLAGWESLYMRASPLSKMMRLYAVIGSDASTSPQIGRVFRRCFASVSAFYGEDERQLRALADRYGVPVAARTKLRSLPVPIKSLQRRPDEIVPVDAFDVEAESWRLFLKALSADGGFLATSITQDEGAQ